MRTVTQAVQPAAPILSADAAEFTSTRNTACADPEARRHYCSRCGHSGDYAGTGPHTCPGCDCKLLPVPSGVAPTLPVDPAAIPNTSSTTANPPELLQRLSHLMQAAGLETCHPWRVLIAQCLAKAAGCKRAPFGPAGRLVSLDQTPTPILVLRQLDAWFNQAGYSDSHPWRLAIAAAVSVPAVPASILPAELADAFTPDASHVNSSTDLWLTTKAAPMFDLAARYSINAGASLPDLLSDGHALLSSAVGVLQSMELTEDQHFAVLHLLRQAERIIGLADEMVENLQFAGLIGGAG